MDTMDYSIDERLHRIERRNGWLSIALGGLLVLVTVGAKGAQDEVRAESFQLVDSSGAVRARLVMNGGHPGLFLTDESGTDRLKLFYEPDGTGLFFADEDGTTRIGIAQFAHGGGGVALHDPDSKGAAVLSLKGEGSLGFFDAEGNVTNIVAASPSPTQE